MLTASMLTILSWLGTPLSGLIPYSPNEDNKIPQLGHPWVIMTPSAKITKQMVDISCKMHYHHMTPDTTIWLVVDWQPIQNHKLQMSFSVVWGNGEYLGEMSQIGKFVVCVFEKLPIPVRVEYHRAANKQTKNAYQKKLLSRLLYQPNFHTECIHFGW